MRKFITFFVFIFCFHNLLQSQILVPKENIISNYPILTDGSSDFWSGFVFSSSPTNIVFDLSRTFKINQIKCSFQILNGMIYGMLNFYTGPSNIGPWSLINSYNFPAFSGILNPMLYDTTLIINNIKISRFVKFEVYNTSNFTRMTEIDVFYDPHQIIESNSGVLLNDNCTNLTAFSNNESYLWSTGETTQSINVCSSGTYTVSVTNTSFTGNQDHIASISISKLGSQDELPGPNGEVYAITKCANKIYIGGDFNSFGPITGNGAQIDSGSAIANTKLPRIDGIINTVISDGNGGWYVGGNFSHVGNYSIHNLCHIKPDNSLDTLFKPEPNNTVHTLALNGTSLYLGGEFTSVKSLTNNYLAKVDFSNGDPHLWDPSVNGIVRSIQLYSDKIIIGGSFTSLGGASRSNLGAIDTIYLQAINWIPNPNATVYKVYISGNKLYIGGDFTSISGLSKSRGAGYTIPNFVLDGYDFGANGRINDFIVFENTLYVGGEFTTIGGANRNYIAALNPQNALANSFNANSNGYVKSMSVSNGKLVVGGLFSIIGGVSRNRLALINMSTGSALNWNPRIAGLKGNTYYINTIAVYGDRIYAGGSFYSAGAEDRNNLACIDESTGQLTTWNPNANNIVRAIVANNNYVYIGGDFTLINGNIIKNRIAQISAETGIASGWNPNSNGSVNALFLKDNLIYVGGNFSSIGGGSRSNVAALSSTTGAASAFNPSANGIVNALCMGGDTLYIAGGFTSIGGQTRNRVASYNILSNTLTSLDPNSNNTVNTLAFFNNKLYIGGIFTKISSINKVAFAEFDVITNSVTSLTHHISSTNGINTIFTKDSSLYLGGGFNFPNQGYPINNLGSINTSSDYIGYWQPQPDNTIRSIFVSDNKVYVGGSFKNITKRYQPYFASTDLFYLNKPLITNVSPINVCQNSSITITGNNFLGATSVKIGNNNSPYNIISNDTIIVFPTMACSGVITVSNALGNGVGTQVITVNPLPVAAGTISGTTTVCQGESSVTYTVPTITNATSYTWTLPSGAIGTSTANSITVSYSNIAMSGNVTVKGNNACGSGMVSTLAITVDPLPVAGGTISGTTTVCQGQSSITYTVPAITNATSYTWTLPTGATGTSTTNSITVSYGTSAVSGNITVKGNNACGSGTESTIAITVNPLPVSAGTISGTTTVCQGQSSVTYTVPSITNATSYIWTLPIGATGTSTTNSISVDFGISAVSGNITVKGNNSCGDGALSSLSIIVNPLPVAAGTITGTETVCQGQSSVTYTVPAITNAISYTWTLPIGATGTSTTNSINVSYGTSAVSGSITVQGNNACGSGTVSTLAVTVNPLPVAAGSITGTTTVCQGQSSITYTVPAITNATSYTWTLPTGATGSSTTNSITVSYGTSAVSGNITVKGNNACGSGTESTIAITVNPLPVSAGTIIGITTVCQGQSSVTYTVPSITNATSYIWTLPTGATGISTTNNITVSYGTSAVSGNITVQGNNACGSGTISTLAISVNPLPVAAGTMSGLTSVCLGQSSVTYTVPPITNATSYSWTIPTGATGSSTTNSITVNYGASAESGNISVYGINPCGQGSNSTLAINVNQLVASAGTISGTTTVCQGESSVTYNVPAIANATTYTWTLPTGATGTSTTNSIIVSYSYSAVSGNITVKGNNACGSGMVSTLAITVDPLPVAAGTISGTTTVCQGQSSITYTVPAITNATSYTWTLPTGATGSSTTNSITVSYGTSAVSGNITVKGNNACGSSTESTLAIIVNPLPVAAGTISGTTTVCQGQSFVTYTVPTITNATSYTWTLPTGATGLSTTNSITVNYGTLAVSGNITVKGNNACGSGTESTLAISVNPLPVTAGTITGTATVCQGQSSVTYTVPAITNATSYIWTLPTGTTGTSTTNNITVNYGTSAFSGDITVQGNNSCGSGPISSLFITVNPLPSAAGSIVGSTSVCPGQSSVTYIVPTISNATSYLWTLPSGATGSSSTNIISVNYGLSAMSGNITVMGINSCGYNDASSLAISVTPLPVAAGTISGSTSVCQGQSSVTYTVPSITNATSYIWTLPTGATGTSSTNSISLDFGTSAVSGNITVKGNNSCGDGALSSLSIIVNPLPVAAGTITGPATVCQGQTSITYTVPDITNATSYTWALPTGATGTSTSNSITVSYGTNAVSGNIIVKGNNSCGEGLVSSKSIMVNPLPDAAGIISGNAIVCQGENSVVYSIPSISNATSYLWTLPNGSTGTSTTNSISVNFGTTAVSGNVSVRGSNACGEGDISTKAITIKYRSTNSIDSIVCNSYTAPDGQTYTTSGTKYAVLINSMGCDSVITINLTVNESTSSTINTTVCDSYTAPDGQIYTTSGTKTAIIPNAAGCDSTITINLIVNTTPETPTISLYEDRLISSSMDGNQWYNQDGIIPNETNQELVFTENGAYFVIVTQNDCPSDSSNLILVNNVQVQKFDKKLIIISPNPFTDLLSIKNKSLETYQYFMYNSVGQLILKGKLENETLINTSDLAKGLYVIKFVNSLGQVYNKVIKQ